MRSAPAPLSRRAPTGACSRAGGRAWAHFANSGPSPDCCTLTAFLAIFATLHPHIAVHI
ncbi:Uncharacterized protein ToN1_28690 [Aromatoleum petrolei]|nr:Uncharacterized protein ToN1_28690 [Aromatoleum petrolei]